MFSGCPRELENLENLEVSRNLKMGPKCQGISRKQLKSGNNRKNDLLLIMTPEKQDKTLELSKHWSVDSTPARNQVIMKRAYPIKSVKCDKICSNY